MSDRIHGLIVVLDADYRREDLEPLLTALRQMKGVGSVAPVPFDPHRWLERERVRLDLVAKLWEVLKMSTRTIREVLEAVKAHGALDLSVKAEFSLNDLLAIEKGVKHISVAGISGWAEGRYNEDDDAEAMRVMKAIADGVSNDHDPDHSPPPRKP